MSDLPAIAGSGGTFNIGGKDYRWTPLTIRRLADFEAEIRSIIPERLDVIGAAKAACDAAKLGVEDRKAVFDIAAKEHIRLRTLGPFDLMREFAVPDVDAVMFKHHLLPAHPDITTEQCREMMSNQVVAAISRMMHEQVLAALPKKDNLPNLAGASASRTNKPGRKGRRKPSR